MVSLSSSAYIKLHAAFQLGLAVYLTVSREVITDDELLYQDGRGRLRIVREILPYQVQKIRCIISLLLEPKLRLTCRYLS
jgi:hypothetical protein